MNSWRAKRYSVSFGRKVGRVNRRHRVTLTVRRFRLAARTGLSHQLTWNIPFGAIRQLQVEYRRFGSKKQFNGAKRWQLATATLLILIGMSGVVLSVSALGKTKSIAPAQAYAVPVKAPEESKPLSLPKSQPTHITIASQQIDTGLMPVGLNEDGSIETPPVLEAIAGWYKYSPTPGEIGPAVIVGHVDSYEDISVFWRLRYVVAGDMIDVAREDGTTARFQVTGLAQYDQANFPTETVYGNTKDAELRVITCGGVFDTSTSHYTENTVVFAKLVS